MARRMRKRFGATPALEDAADALCGDAEAPWRDACGRALARRQRSEISAHALWRDACGNDMTRRLRRRYGASYAEALWRDACGSAMARRLRKRSEETHANAAARHLWKRCGVTPVEALSGDPAHFGAMPADALWRDACVSALATTEEALWRDTCARAMARRLRKRL